MEDGCSHRLLHKEDGYFQGIFPARAGDRYKVLIDGKGPFPDPASRYQPEGPHGWSEIVDPDAFQWRRSVGAIQKAGAEEPGTVRATYRHLCRRWNVSSRRE